MNEKVQAQLDLLIKRYPELKVCKDSKAEESF